MNAIDKFALNRVNNNEALRAEIIGKSKEADFIKLMRQQKILYRIEVKNWRAAHQDAIDIERPTREELMNIYDDAMLDPHLGAVINQRILDVLNIPAEVYDLDTGEEDEDATKLIQKRWFYDANKFLIETVPYGFSPLKWDFKQGTNLQWEVAKVSIFAREHCVPEYNGIRPDVSGEEIIYFHDKPYNRFYMLIDSGDLGLLLKASRYTIFKKYAVNHWNRYQDIYGIPPISANTSSRDDEVWDKIEKNLRGMSNSLGGIFPDGTELKVHEMSNTDTHNLFQQAIKEADEQNSKLFLGGSGNMDEKSHVGSAEVQERSKKDIMKADVRMCEHEWNDRILPFLTSWGYPFEGKGIRFNLSSKLPLANNQLEIDKWVSENFEIDEGYVEETYGTPVTGRKQHHSPGGDQQKEEEPKK